MRIPKHVNIMVLFEKHEGSCWLKDFASVRQEMKGWRIQSFESTTAVHGERLNASHDYDGRDEIFGKPWDSLWATVYVVKMLWLLISNP